MRRPSDRDLEILQAVAHGAPLNWTDDAVKNWFSRIASKYCVKTLTAAIVIATYEGHIAHPPLVTPLAPLNKEWEARLLQLAATDVTRNERLKILGLSKSQYLTLIASVVRKMRANSLEQALYHACGLKMFSHDRHPKHPGERELAALIATTQHETLEDAADDVGVSLVNLKHLIKSARDQLRATTTPQAVAHAIRLEFILVESPEEPLPHSLGYDDRFVLMALSRGMRNADIAQNLSINNAEPPSARRVEAFVRATLRRLGTKSRPKAVFLGFQHGILR